MKHLESAGQNAPVMSVAPTADELNMALLAAVCRQDADEVRALLRAGASPNTREDAEAGRSLLHIAVGFRRDSGILSMLLAAGARLNAKDAKGNTPLRLATKEGTAWSVRLLLAAGAEAVADTSRPGSLTPLREGQQQLQAERCRRRAEVVRMLGKGQPPLGAADAARLRKLMLAINRGSMSDIRRLLRDGAPLNDLCHERLEAPLHLAVAKGDMRVLRLLLDAGADVNQFSTYGRTPMMRAMGRGNPLIISALLRAGADPNLRDSKGLRALDYCNDAECRHMLISHGALRGKENA